MDTYRLRGADVKAVQWFKNGDHPHDDVMRPFEDTGELPTQHREGKVVRYFRRPDAEPSCRWCGEPMDDHGWIDNGGDGETVCPGDWVLNIGDHYTSISDDSFRQFYEQVSPNVLEFGTGDKLVLWGEIGGIPMVLVKQADDCQEIGSEVPTEGLSLEWEPTDVALIFHKPESARVVIEAIEACISQLEVTPVSP